VHDAVAAALAAATVGVPCRVYNIGSGSTCGIPTFMLALAHTGLGFVPAVDLEEGLTAEYQCLTGILK
jgi:hypothetical protein